MKGNIFYSVVFSGLVFCLVCFAFMLTEKTRLTQAKLYYDGVEVERGAHLYTLHCQSCHGSRGEGIGQLGPPLNEENFFAKRTAEVGWTATLEEYITSTTAHGRMMGTRPMYAGNGSTMVMPPWGIEDGGPLQQYEISVLTDYIMNWKSTATGAVEFEKLLIPATNVVDEEVVNKGNDVFIRKCGGCHGFQDQFPGRGKGPDLTDIKTFGGERKEGISAAEYVEESLLIPDMHIAPGFEVSKNGSTCGPILTISELKAVSMFLLK